MLWRVTTKTCNPKALEFCKLWLLRYDYDNIDHIAIKKGKPGYGIYGWCDYNPDIPRPFTLALHIPGPFPHTAITKEPSLEVPIKIEIPEGQTVASHNVSISKSLVKVKLVTHTPLKTSAEALVFLFGHELHHFLASDGQVTTEDTEKEADNYGKLLLDEYAKCSN